MPARRPSSSANGMSSGTYEGRGSSRSRLQVSAPITDPSDARTGTHRIERRRSISTTVISDDDCVDDQPSRNSVTQVEVPNRMARTMGCCEVKRLSSVYCSKSERISARGWAMATRSYAPSAPTKSMVHAVANDFATASAIFRSVSSKSREPYMAAPASARARSPISIFPRRSSARRCSSMSTFTPTQRTIVPVPSRCGRARTRCQR